MEANNINNILYIKHTKHNKYNTKQTNRKLKVNRVNLFGLGKVWNKVRNRWSKKPNIVIIDAFINLPGRKKKKSALQIHSKTNFLFSLAFMSPSKTPRIWFSSPSNGVRAGNASSASSQETGVTSGSVGGKSHKTLTSTHTRTHARTHLDKNANNKSSM